MWIADDWIACIHRDGRRNIVGWWCLGLINWLLLRGRLVLWGSIGVVLLLAGWRLLV